MTSNDNTGAAVDKTPATPTATVTQTTTVTPAAPAVAAPEFGYSQKSEFVATMQTHLTEAHRDVDQLSKKVERGNETVKIEGKTKLQTVRDQMTKLHAQLAEAKNSTENTWSDAKVGFRKGLDQMKDGLQQTRQWVSEKIAP